MERHRQRRRIWPSDAPPSAVIMPLLLYLTVHRHAQRNFVQAFTTRETPHPSSCCFFVHRQRPTTCSHSNRLFIPVEIRYQNYKTASPLFATKIEDVLHATTNKTETPQKQLPSGNKQIVSHLENDAHLSTFAINNPTWDQNIAAMLEYKEIHATVNIPQYSKEYPNLALWMKNLRQDKGRLTQDQIADLDGIGFLWTDAHLDKHERWWMAMFEALKEYKDTHGHCRVPVDKSKLGGWVKTQRRQYTTGNFRRDRQEMLESIGFEWRLKRFVEVKKPEHETLWNFQYAALCKFKEQHGHPRAPRPYPKMKNWAIGSTISGIETKMAPYELTGKKNLTKLGLFGTSMRFLKNLGWKAMGS
ncbi:helicase [Seminavis robusta]|uniref:Helicase n=1 Tax=Seminavis robusta TaxID=568900 RepID=A0A9N8DN25_9STRA|nr:helicase [Seminavis robusta]|eukprot:Sro170_g075540.1 helicase (359) ;mRNA; r:84410-85486